MPQQFSIKQAQKIQSAMDLLPERQRDHFARSVCNRLRGYSRFSDRAVDTTIAQVLGCYGVSAPRFPDPIRNATKERALHEQG
jgi:hypothetical protein